MGQQECHTNSEPSTTQRCVVRFSIDGDLRFISHRDTLRMFHRALARADVPVRFSTGFNPQPRVSLPLPRPVGVASDDELLIVELCDCIPAAKVLKRLQDQAPRGVEVRNVRLSCLRHSPVPQSVRYRLDLNDVAPAYAAKRAQEIRESPTLSVSRFSRKRGQTKVVDIRPFVTDLTLVGGSVEFTLAYVHGESAKPREVAALLGMDEAHVNHLVRRLQVRWQQEP